MSFDALALAAAGLAAVCNRHGCLPEDVRELRVYDYPQSVLGFLAAADITVTALASDLPEVPAS